jgi:hypothetical protein
MLEISVELIQIGIRVMFELRFNVTFEFKFMLKIELIQTRIEERILLIF